MYSIKSKKNTVGLGGRFHTPVLDNTIKLPYLRSTPGTQKQESKKIPYLRTENLKNHTLFRGTYLYSPYMGVPPPPGLAETAIYIVERWKKGMGYCFVPECNHAQGSRTCHIFPAIFAWPRFVKFRDVTTSPLGNWEKKIQALPIQNQGFAIRLLSQW